MLIYRIRIFEEKVIIVLGQESREVPWLLFFGGK